MPLFKSNRLALVFLLLLSLAACRDSSVQPQPKYSITGVVNGGGAGVSVRATGPDTQTVTTRADGTYAFTELEPGQYTVAPTQPGSIFDPVETVVTLASADVVAPPFVRRAPEEGLPIADLQRLDATPDRSLPADSVILPNGQSLAAYAAARGFPLTAEAPAGDRSGFRAAATEVSGPQQRRNDIVAQMLGAARDYACARRPNPCTKWNRDADPADPAKRPAQTGLTYIWGGKNPLERTRGTDGCPQFTFGMDCSGLVSNIARTAGITSPPAGSANQADPDNWRFPADWQLKMKVVEEGRVQSGDLIAWPGHIGIAESSGAGASVNVISSTGAPGECIKNISPPRGPRSLPMTTFKGTPTVLRLVTTLSGEFDLYIRCTDQSTDAAVLHFTINNEDGGPFSTTGTGTDYNGAPLAFRLEGTYDQVKNVLDARLILTNGNRIDGIHVELLEDDTGYFPMTKIVDNGGCPASGRLVRVTEQTQARLPVRSPSSPRSSSGPRLGGPPPRP